MDHSSPTLFLIVLVWFGLDWFGLDWLRWYIQPVFFIHHKKSIVKTPTQPSLTLVGCYTKMGLHNLAPAAARPPGTSIFSFYSFKSFQILIPCQFLPSWLQRKMDYSSPTLFLIVLVWFGLVWIGLGGIFNLFFYSSQE